MIKIIHFSFDTDKHSLVHIGLTNHTEPSTSAYLRKCVEFYEMNRGGAVNQHLILERLERIEKMLRGGQVVSAQSDQPDDDALTDEILDQALEQLE